MMKQKKLEYLRNNIPYTKDIKEIKSKVIPHNKQYFKISSKNCRRI